jgi:NADH:ubiquinone oxidoreductase subunit D
MQSVDGGWAMARIETKTEPMVLNMGPHHPSMHGCFRLMVTLDGEEVIDCEPVIGYLHRGMEKIAENRTNIMFVPYVSRWDYAAGMLDEERRKMGSKFSLKELTISALMQMEKL